MTVHFSRFFQKYHYGSFAEIWNYPSRFDWSDEVQAETESHPDTGGYHETQRGKSLMRSRRPFPFVIPLLLAHESLNDRTEGGLAKKDEGLSQYGIPWVCEIHHSYSFHRYEPLWQKLPSPLMSWKNFMLSSRWVSKQISAHSKRWKMKGFTLIIPWVLDFSVKLRGTWVSAYMTRKTELGIQNCST